MEVDMTDPTTNESEDPKKARSRKGEHEPDEQLVPTTPATTETIFGDRGSIPPSVSVTLRRSEIPETEVDRLWPAIRNRTIAIRFDAYRAFVDKVLGDDPKRKLFGSSDGNNYARLNREQGELFKPIHGVGAFELLKTATQVFLLLECGFCGEDELNLQERDKFPLGDKERGKTIYNPVEEAARLGLGGRLELEDVRRKLRVYLGDGLPYINTVLENAFEGFDKSESIFCPGYLASRADCPPLIELIWSYWHEEAMLVQSMNAISLRFQNRRSAAARDPLAHIEVAPLFPINNLLWGYIQDEQHRLSVPRRAYEYNHHYGLTLAGKAIPEFRPAETRSKFLEALHHLLYLSTVFFKQDDDTTVNADAFTVLNALKEVHLLLAEGAHNQFGDLPWTARAEMLMEQWILSRPEMRLFLQSRQMVPYREGWMGQVDTMKRLQGWTDVTVTHFNDLAIFGEQLLLSVRYGNWNLVNDHAQAGNWARYWRPEIQNYIHSYRAVTSVDLRADPASTQQRQLVTTLPTELIRQRLNGKSAPALPAPTSAIAPKSFRERQAARRANGSSG
jgi:hypothetical protein